MNPPLTPTNPNRPTIRGLMVVGLIAAGTLLTVAGAAYLGWEMGGWIGLVLGIAVGAFLAVGGLFASMFLYAMSQDAQ